jgi:hypothetical protein
MCLFLKIDCESSTRTSSRIIDAHVIDAQGERQFALRFTKQYLFEIGGSNTYHSLLGRERNSEGSSINSQKLISPTITNQ